jgi:hypothetical protein
MTILPVGAKLFHADGQTFRRNEANSRFSQFFEGVYKLIRALKRHHNTQNPIQQFETITWCNLDAHSLCPQHPKPQI